MITKRTLIKWRKEALEAKETTRGTYKCYYEMADRILRLTQELYDIELIERYSNAPLLKKEPFIAFEREEE